jgi:hypothetical protein
MAHRTSARRKRAQGSDQKSHSRRIMSCSAHARADLSVLRRRAANVRCCAAVKACAPRLEPEKLGVGEAAIPALFQYPLLGPAHRSIAFSTKRITWKRS